MSSLLKKFNEFSINASYSLPLKLFLIIYEGYFRINLHAFFFYISSNENYFGHPKIGYQIDKMGQREYLPIGSENWPIHK